MAPPKVAVYLTAGEIESLLRVVDDELEQAAVYGPSTDAELAAARDELARFGGAAKGASQFWRSEPT